jgi:hypothetical protein
MVNKLGIGALVVGLLIVIAEWLVFFAPNAGGATGAALTAFLTYLLVGGLLWLGLGLVLLGVLILLI